MVWWKTVASVVAFLLGVGVSAPALAGLNATWVDKAVAASQTSPTEDSWDAEEADNSPEAGDYTDSSAHVSQAVDTVSGNSVSLVADTSSETPQGWNQGINWTGEFTGSSTVTYNANGGSYEDGSASYDVTSEYDKYGNVEKYSHSGNYTDSGENTGERLPRNYGSTEVVTIEGAKSVFVDMTGFFQQYFGSVCVVKGALPNLTGCPSNTVFEISGRWDSSPVRQTATIKGDTITIYAWARSSNNPLYGYYSSIRGVGGSFKDLNEYAEPFSYGLEKDFVGWNTRADGSGVDLGSGRVSLKESGVVYAQWADAENSWKTWNTVQWRASNDGKVAYVKPLEGTSGVLGRVNSSGSAPWKGVNSFKSIGRIILNSDSSYLFRGMNILDLSGVKDWDASQVATFERAFFYSNLDNVDALSNWDVSNVTDMDSMFYSSTLTNIRGLATWDTGKLKDIRWLFNGCKNLEDITPISHWNVESLIDVSEALDGTSVVDTSSLVEWNLGSHEISGTIMSGFGTDGLERIGVPENGKSLIPYDRLYNKDDLIRYSKTMIIDGLPDLKGVWEVVPDSGYWGTCRWWVTDDNTLVVKEGVGSDDSYPYADAAFAVRPFERVKSKVVRLNFERVVFPEKSIRIFSGFSNLESLDTLENVDVSNVKYFGYTGINAYFGIFLDCGKIVDLSPLANWDVGNVVSMYKMFANCVKINNLNALANWGSKLDNLEDLRYTFYRCESLSDISGLSTWKTSKVKYMGYYGTGVPTEGGIFDGCKSLSDISPLKDWDVSSVIDMSFAFQNTSVSDFNPISGWDTSSVNNMKGTFYGAKHTSLDFIKTWDLSNVIYLGGDGNTRGAFAGPNLKDASAVSEANLKRLSTRDWGMFRSRSSDYFSGNLARVGIPGNDKGAKVALSSIIRSEVSGKWVREDAPGDPKTFTELYNEYDQNPDVFQEGTIWLRYTPSYFLDFNPNGGIGSTKSLMTPLASTATLPDSTFLRFGYKFIGWTTQPGLISDMNPLMKPSQQFRPASPTDAARYTLYAQWEKLGDTSNLPESSQTGILPGWVQVGSENTNGLIPPMDTAIASFINKYSPDQTSITFRFLKLLDGNVPSASDTFTFDIYDESGKLVQTATNVGSTITFAPLGFSKAGVFTYFISERQDPSNKINEDDNVIQATVTVVEEDGKLKATAQLLGDTTFRNETKPAELTISKKVVLPEWSDITDDDQETFKFHVTLKKDASPLSGTFDGVTFDESGTATIEVKGNTQKTIKGIPAGTTYTVNEVDIPQGYSNTDKTNTNGNLLADSSVTSEWENTYTPANATAQLQASKRYFDQSNIEFNLKGGEFGFSACEIIDSNTSTGCVTATNDRTGKVEFPVLTYSTPGIHTYRIAEDITSTDKSIAFDRKAYTVTVEVADNGEGSLVSKVRYNTADGSVPVFVNRNTVMSALPVTGSYAVWAAVFAAVVLVVWFAAPGRRRR